MDFLTTSMGFPGTGIYYTDTKKWERVGIILLQGELTKRQAFLREIEQILIKVRIFLRMTGRPIWHQCVQYMMQMMT